ncbi:MAG: Bro-N domain-containing protein [Firmicutes bacterium]|nr:Bro-N domain-containing protein [Bacillota bacterium]
MSNIRLFNDKQIRTHWDSEKEEWYFSVVDICGVLSESSDPRNYWKVLKNRLKAEGSQLVTICNQLKMQSSDGKFYNTDVLDTAGILRLVQSIPSPNAEPFKIWLAQVGSERIDEIYDPEIAIHRALEFYRKKGYTEGWINQRLKTIEMRKELTDEWKDKGATTGKDYAILTDEMISAWSGMSTREYKAHKDLTKENLRDNMTNIELVLNMLAEVTTTAISKTENPQNMTENVSIARRGGSVAKSAKDSFEKETGQSVISKVNARNKEMLEIENRENK